MESKFSNNPDQINNFIESINKDIFDEDIWIKKEMWKIAEVTYSYNAKNHGTKLSLHNKPSNINTTLFCQIGGLDIDEYTNADDTKKELLLMISKDTLIGHITNKRQLITQAISKIHLYISQKLTFLSNAQLQLTLNALIEKDQLLEYCELGIPYELEKAGLKQNLNEKSIEKIDKKLELLDKELFSWNIIDNPEEVWMCFSYLTQEYNKKKDNLSIDEQNVYEEYLLKIHNILPKNHKKIFKSKPKSLLQEFSHIHIPRNEYLLWFNLSVESLTYLKHIVTQNDSAKSISDGPTWIQFPTTNKFNEITLDRFLKLNAHEIEVHSITDHNNSQLIWNIRGAKSIIKDEGLAVLMERLLEYGNQLFTIDSDSNKIIIDKDKFQVSYNFCAILIWEISDNNELMTFLELHEKISPDVIEIKSRYDRLKRSNHQRIQHKDTSYTRWLFQAIDMINTYILSEWEQGHSFEDLFLWKCSFKDLDVFKELKKQKESTCQKHNIVKVHFSSDHIIYAQQQRIHPNKLSFVEYLRNKYPILSFSEEEILNISPATQNSINALITLSQNAIDSWNSQNLH